MRSPPLSLGSIAPDRVQDPLNEIPYIDKVTSTYTQDAHLEQ